MVTTRILGALVALAALTACSPSTSPSATPSAPTGTPTPTFLCTPEAGGAEAPCTQDEYEQMKARDAEYAEAERVYRAVLAIRNAAYAGESAPALAPYVTGSAFTDLNAEVSGGYRLRPGSLRIGSLHRLPDVSREGSTVALEVCLDLTGNVLVRNGAQISSPDYVSERAYFRWDEAALMLAYIETKVVTGC